MNKLTILSTAISLGLIQQDQIILGVLLVVVTFFISAILLNSINKK